MMEPLRLVFMGTPDFAVPVLDTLRDAGHAVVAVYTQPPRGAGRGKKTRLTPVQRFARARHIEVRTPGRLKDEGVVDGFTALGADAAVVVAYGLILPPAVLAAPRLGCLNLHASLLPRWRGAAPIPRAIMAGDAVSGLTVMRMDAGLDTGPILLTEDVPIGPITTAGELHDEMAQRGGPLMVRALAGVAAGELADRPQPAEGVTYAAKLAPGDERIDWRRPAADLERQVRALAPRPGAWFVCAGERIKVAAAALASPAGGDPGVVLDDRLTVACGAGALGLEILQRAGRKPLTAEEFLRGFAVPAGTRLELP